MANILNNFGIDETMCYRFIVNSVIIEGFPELIRDDKKNLLGIKLTKVKFLHPDNPSLITAENYLFLSHEDVSAFWVA